MLYIGSLNRETYVSINYIYFDQPIKIDIAEFKKQI